MSDWCVKVGAWNPKSFIRTTCFVNQLLVCQLIHVPLALARGASWPQIQLHRLTIARPLLARRCLVANALPVDGQLAPQHVSTDGQ